MITPVSLAIGIFAMAGCYGDMRSTADVSEQGAQGDTGEPIPTDLEFSCLEPRATGDDGFHYPGSACLGCHNGSVGPAFSVAGTLFSDKAGEQPLSGATVTLIDAADNQIDMLATLNGNFWTDQAVELPAIAFVSSCPDVQPMPVFVEAADCNACHDPAQSSGMAFAPRQQLRLRTPSTRSVHSDPGGAGASRP